jgi:hypothetical protein
MLVGNGKKSGYRSGLETLQRHLETGIMIFAVFDFTNLDPVYSQTLKAVQMDALCLSIRAVLVKLVFTGSELDRCSELHRCSRPIFTS